MKSLLIDRRAALGAFAATPLAAPALANGPTGAHPTPAGPSLPANACILSPQAVEGPFYYDPHLVREDITEGRPGVPLELAITLLDAATCVPLSGARADVWHADASGAYSGYDEKTPRETFMRGTQMAGADGRVTFRTVYPGWYSGRTPHIHLKVFVDARNVLTTQLYFPDALSEYLYDKVAAYGGRTEARDTVNATDGVLSHTKDGRSTFLAIREEADRYVGSIVIAADRRATPAAMGMPGGPPPPPPGDRRGPPPPGGPRPMGDRGAPPPGEGMRPQPRPSGPLVPGAKA